MPMLDETRKELEAYLAGVAKESGFEPKFEYDPKTGWVTVTGTRAGQTQRLGVSHATLWRSPGDAKNARAAIDHVAGVLKGAPPPS